MNRLENKLIVVVDRPMELFRNNVTVISNNSPPFVKSKINLRKKLLERFIGAKPM